MQEGEENGEKERGLRGGTYKVGRCMGQGVRERIKNGSVK